MICVCILKFANLEVNLLNLLIENLKQIYYLVLSTEYYVLVRISLNMAIIEIKLTSINYS